PVNTKNKTNNYLTSQDPKADYCQYSKYAINKEHLEYTSRYLWLTGYNSLILVDKETGTAVAKKDL
ncbi:hypothetical protein, partial [Pseudoalteromonas sp. S1691]|uniref:hypothetical protein n=1 Tax=Pseudoalteromonas sp. S1691 TaxID=579513 RepID=UPI001BB17131